MQIFTILLFETSSPYCSLNRYMRVKELILETRDVVVNRQLNPILWENEKLAAQVVDKLEEIATAFVEFVKIPLNVVDYTLTGSNANYTWNKHSDLDLHVIVRGEVSDSARELYTAKKALWAAEHTITIKGLPVECYIQGEQDPHHSSGVYSLMQNKWIVKPKKIKPKIDDSAVDAKQTALAGMTKKALDEDDLDQLRAVKDKITTMRKAGLERAGEWSTENLVFKNLRNDGFIDDLADRIRELEDQQLSLEQLTPQLD